MAKFAWVENNVAREVIDFNPQGRFHPDIAKLFEAVPDIVNQGATRNQSGVWTAYVKPVAPTPPTPPRTISQDDVRKKLTLAERVKWDNGSVPEVITAKIEFSQPRLVADATEILNLLVGAGVISQASADSILA